jgi:peptide/nickel transport system substrate-binding protein/oligopeptide transport system substrate-binding protein
MMAIMIKAEVNIDKAVELLTKLQASSLMIATCFQLIRRSTSTYLTNDGTGHVAIAQQIQQDLAQVGITTDDHPAGRLADIP